MLIRTVIRNLAWKYLGVEYEKETYDLLLFFFFVDGSFYLDSEFFIFLSNY